jgi:flagellar hook assembly protein FlgD
MTSASIVSASDIQMDYMKLLVTQLQNQNPLEPLDNNEMASQLAQFSQLQQLESMSLSFADVLITINRSYANSLLGKNVTFYARDETTGELNKKVGTVDSVFNDPDTGESLLGVTVGDGGEAGEYTLGLDAVILVEN